MHNRMLGVVEMSNDNGSWVETGFCEDTQLPIYERKGDGKWAVQGKEGEGVYICANGFRNYYDEHGRYYMLKSDYLARNDPPEPEPKAEVEETPRKKAEPEFNPFAQARDLDDMSELIAWHDPREWNETYGWVIMRIDDMIQKHPIAEEALKELRSQIIEDNTYEGDEEQ